MVAEQIAGRGVRSEAVLAAMRRIPRELFMPPPIRERAYDDSALPIDCEQTISQPYIVAYMTEALGLTPASRVLEIGTGSGYQAAILACVVREVLTIEWHLKLMNQAAERLAGLGLTNVAFRCADGSLGWPERAPFDAIIVTAGAPVVPQTLCEQLAPGGRLIIPTGPPGDQTLILIRRTEHRFEQEELIKCRFVKLVGAEGWSE